MMYIFDTCILVNANRVQFPISTNNLFWDWLVDCGKQGKIKIPESVFDEIGEGNDGLAQWIKQNKEHFFIPKDDAYTHMPAVMDAYVKAYGQDSSFPEGTLETLKADPYVVAHAKGLSASVATGELAKNGKLANYKEVKIPHVCQLLNIPCFTFIQFLWAIRADLPE